VFIRKIALSINVYSSAGIVDRAEILVRDPPFKYDNLPSVEGTYDQGIALT
jgi:hypothetical protein